MKTPLTPQEIRKIVIDSLPELLESDPKVRKLVLSMTKDKYADKEKTEDRIDRILDELKRDRERSEKKWAENREDQEKRWAENQRAINEILEELKATRTRHESSIGALGARWGLQSESAFRNGLAAILSKSFGVTVERYLDFDEEGKVFGRPDQVELDIIIHNGTLIIAEIKSSIDKSQMYAFWRKKFFYEEKHNRKASRTLVISPMVDDKARKVAQDLGVEVYSYADGVTF